MPRQYRVTLLYRSSTEDTTDDVRAEVSAALENWDPMCEAAVESCTEEAERASDARDVKDVQRAHDILHFLGTPAAPAIFGDPIPIHSAHDALAWVLGFPCGDTFAANVADAITTLRQLGYREVDAGEPISPEEAQRRGLA